MPKKNIVKKDILNVIADFQRDIQDNVRTAQQMYDEIRMMHFKIRPLNGDIAHIDLKDRMFLEALWSLGKLDEFIRREGSKYTKRERDIFFRFFDSLHTRFSKSLSRIRIDALDDEEDDSQPYVEMEIYREDVRRKKFN